MIALFADAPPEMLVGHAATSGSNPLNPNSFQYSLLRVFDPSTTMSAINAAGTHFELALDTRKHGLNMAKVQFLERILKLN